ncbi:Homeobox-leucine zipper protein hat22 [Stylosanthes scabra]|uniref:Homeobox-leucine zipper protein hat22 n=1 Tax=Stylosanthes scabra TaxID=79078 RepID=A0ABU6UBZ5_9FABA|nr:Homeobox-leucine zipper protein hat22 [Stylosanthes scabra]
MGLDHHPNPNNNNNNNSSSSGLQLVLGLSLTTTTTAEETTATPPPPSTKPKLCSGDDTTEPSLTLGLSGESFHQQILKSKMMIMDSATGPGNNNNKSGGYCEEPTSGEMCRQASPHGSAVSSFSSGGCRVVAACVKRERDLSSCEEADGDGDGERVSSRVSDEDEDGTNARKKLRLTKEQSALLEDSFKQHSTLNPKQKQALARQLNLRPRQVEVWFQNRRARTKLKQTEVDCEFLKKCCETLTDENRRLKKELQELKALKLAQPLYMPMPAATLTICPSCERLSNDPPPSIAPKPHFYNPFTNPSAAC